MYQLERLKMMLILLKNLQFNTSD